MNDYGFVGDRARDLAKLKELNINDQPRVVEFGLTIRMVESGIQEGLQAAGTADVLDEFYATSDISLKEREIKEEINDYLVTTLDRGIDSEDKNQLAEFDGPAYLWASIVCKLRNEQLDNILASEVSSDDFSLIVSKLLEKHKDYVHRIGNQLAESEDPAIGEVVQKLGICDKEEVEPEFPPAEPEAEKQRVGILNSKWSAILVLLFAFIVGLYFSRDSIETYLSEVRNRV